MATLDEQAKSINDLIDQAQKAVADGDVETARKLKEESEQAKATYNEQKEIADAVQSEEKISSNSDKPASTEKTETEVKNDKPDAESKDVEVTEKKEQPEKVEVKKETVEEPTDDELEDKKKPGGKRSMTRQIIENKQSKLSDEAQGFGDYIKSNSAKRDNVKSVDAQPLIPEDNKYVPEELPETVGVLKKFVNVQTVTTDDGSHPRLSQAQETMNTVQE
ncbi:hypothetical protein [Staphylococcus haemolyticus]|uniref:hypothetical protein n=1 Tax=Staphylococcus haemolyticus TaxID=1283 RepID=UPI0015D71CB6|nr:hypothetical protein [Staphylococcus haemolyticus]